MIDKILKLLEESKWRDEEITLKNFEVAHHVNAILIDIIGKVKVLEKESLTNKITNA